MDIPEMHGCVIAAGREHCAVGAEFQGRTTRRRTRQPAGWLPFDHVPELNVLLIKTARGKHFAIRRKGQPQDPGAWIVERAQLPSGRRVPQVDGLSLAAAGDGLAVWRESHRVMVRPLMVTAVTWCPSPTTASRTATRCATRKSCSRSRIASPSNRITSAATSSAFSRTSKDTF